MWLSKALPACPVGLSSAISPAEQTKLSGAKPKQHVKGKKPAKVQEASEDESVPTVDSEADSSGGTNTRARAAKAAKGRGSSRGGRGRGKAGGRGRGQGKGCGRGRGRACSSDQAGPRVAPTKRLKDDDDDDNNSVPRKATKNASSSAEELEEGNEHELEVEEDVTQRGKRVTKKDKSTKQASAKAKGKATAKAKAKSKAKGNKSRSKPEADNKPSKSGSKAAKGGSRKQKDNEDLDEEELARKQRLSRKSSAYHKAKMEAKKRGASDEEIKKVARQVAEQHVNHHKYVLCVCACVLFLSSCQPSYVHLWAVVIAVVHLRHIRMRSEPAST